jgi:hypothetical protein
VQWWHCKLGPHEEVFYFSFYGRNIFPHRHVRPVNGGVRWWRNEGVACQKMAQSSKTVKQTPVMIAAVNRAHQERMQRQHDWSDWFRKTEETFGMSLIPQWRSENDCFRTVSDETARILTATKILNSRQGQKMHHKWSDITLKNSKISVKYIRATLNDVMTSCFIFRTLPGNPNYCTFFNMTVQVNCYR